MKNDSYMTRAMQARDPRYARLLSKLGYEPRDMVAHSVADQPIGDISDLRKEYNALFGKRPFNGWDAETLAAKIAAEKAK